jgi:Cu(I)/Ag(I) efflux system membrane fusion protein
MFQSRILLSNMIAFGVVAALSGCGSPASNEKPTVMTPAAGNAPKPSTARGEHADHADASGSDVAKGLAELSADDRAAAEKQRVCPVSGSVLGSDGKPVKVMVKGKTVYLCCADCEEAITKDPDKYLAKLKDGPK